MADGPITGGWGQALGKALILVLATAAVARVAWELLVPLVPILLVLAALIGIYRLVFRGYNRW